MTFIEWIKEKSPIISELQAFSKSEIPADREKGSWLLSNVYIYLENCGELRADADSFLRQMRAMETLQTKNTHPNLTGPERSAIIESNLDDILKVRDILKVCYTTLNKLAWELSKSNS